MLLLGKKDLECIKSLIRVQRTEPSSMMIDSDGTRIML